MIVDLWLLMFCKNVILLLCFVNIFWKMNSVKLLMRYRNFYYKSFHSNSLKIIGTKWDKNNSEFKVIFGSLIDCYIFCGWKYISKWWNYVTLSFIHFEIFKICWYILFTSVIFMLHIEYYFECCFLNDLFYFP